MKSRIAPITGSSWIMLPILGVILALGFFGALFASNVHLLSSNATTSTTSSFSGLELVGSNSELSMLRGCSDGQVVKYDGSNRLWGCQADATTAVTGAGADVLDLADDGSDESADFNELATTGDTNSCITEPAADKVLFNLGCDWPKSDTADALAANPADCAAGQYGATIAANGDLTCAQVQFSQLGGAATDAQVPNSITIDALGANGTNCSANQYPSGVDASGNSESCTADANTNASTQCSGTTTYYDGEANCDDISGVYADVTGDTFTGTVSITGSGVELILGLDCSGLTNGGTLSVTGSGVVHCQNDDGGAGGTDTGPAPDCAGTTTYQDGEGNCDTLDGLENFETPTDDAVAVGNATSFDSKVIADCNGAQSAVTYDTATNAFSCNTLYSQHAFAFSQPGTLTTSGTGAEVAAFQVPIFTDFVIQDVECRVGTAPTGASLIVDVNVNGTSIFTTQANRPTIAVSTQEDTSGAPNTTAIDSGDYVDIDIDQVGSTVAGSDLVCMVRVRQAVYNASS